MVGMGCVWGCGDFEHKATEVTEGGYLLRFLFLAYTGYLTIATRRWEVLVRRRRGWTSPRVWRFGDSSWPGALPVEPTVL